MAPVNNDDAPPLRWRSGASHLPGLEGRIPRLPRRAVVLTTLGSLGDLYPVLSLARALEARGIEVRLGLSPEDCDMAERWGLLATPVGPSQADVCAALGMSRDAVAASVLRNPLPLIRRALLPLLPEMIATLSDLARGTACVAATPFALAAAPVAERLALPFVPLTLQPMMSFAPSDPPTGGLYSVLRRRPKNALSLGWNRAVMGAVKLLLRQQLGRPLNRQRAALGLPPLTGTPLIDPGGTIAAHVGLWSEHFAPRAADGPPQITLTGFPPAPEGRLSDDVQRWLDDGPPPLVVTLGSIAQNLGRSDFWAEAAGMARRLGLRAVHLHGEAAAPDGPDLLALPYAAHAPLFPQAAAIVHHGGIGTTAEALRSGRPQLVLPVGGDQPDNAARLCDHGVADTMPIEVFNATQGALRMGELLESFDYIHAAKLAEQILGEDGCAAAADILDGIVSRHLSEVAG